MLCGMVLPRTQKMFKFKDTELCRRVKPLFEAVILCHFSASYFLYGKIQKKNGGLCCGTFKSTAEIWTFV